MHFVDETTITVSSGRGGDGCVAFLREKFRPKGGPAGGDGGDGGDVILRACARMDTLLPLARKRKYAAGNGQPGEGKDRHGRSAEHLVIELPPGSVVRDADSRELLADLAAEGAEVVIVRGGNGGRGNAAFKGPQNQSPLTAEAGRPGEKRRLHLELKLIADVGLVGKPNAGKSTLLSRLSAARPKVADYPFTTRRPCLGIVECGDYRQFVMADIPGLIEGAHAGAGLGHQFLRHIERTGALAHVVELCPLDGSDPAAAYRAIRTELERFNPELARRSEIVVGSKIDLPGADEALDCLRKALPERDVIGISAVTGAGLKELVNKLAGIVVIRSRI